MNPVRTLTPCPFNPPSGLVLLGFTCLAHPILLQLITVIIIGEKYEV